MFLGTASGGDWGHKPGNNHKFTKRRIRIRISGAAGGQSFSVGVSEILPRNRSDGIIPGQGGINCGSRCIFEIAVRSVTRPATTRRQRKDVVSSPCNHQRVTWTSYTVHPLTQEVKAAELW